MKNIQSVRRLPDGSLVAFCDDNGDGVFESVTIPDIVFDQQDRDPETDELIGEVYTVGSTPERTELLAWERDGGVIEDWVLVDPVPSVISDRQFFQQLATQGLITENEALAAVQTGTLPAAILTFIDQLPVEQRFSAKMLLTGATQFERANPLVDAFGGMYGMGPEQVDELWRAASAL